MDSIIYYILSALAVLLILTIHEYAHGYAAYKLGDNTAKSLGRLTLNPIKHLDPVGALCMVLFHFGWAKPVPVNPRNFKNPKKGFASVALAGPLANLIMAFFTGFLYLLLVKVFGGAEFPNRFVLEISKNLLLFVSIFYSVNLGLAIFNLIPIPPLDGSRLLNVFLPPKAYFKIMRYERQIYLALIIWLIGGDVASNFLLSMSFIRTSPVLSVIAEYISLTNIIGALINFVSNGILAFWKLIPFLNY